MADAVDQVTLQAPTAAPPIAAAPVVVCPVPDVSTAAIDGWPPHVQWVTAVAAAVAVVLLAWRGWGLTAWSTRPLPLDRDAFVAPLDVNLATERELMAVPGVGPAMARQIVAHREARGPFRAIDELQGVPGVGPVTAARLKEHLGVEDDRLPPRVARGVAPAAGRGKKAVPDGVVDLNRAAVEELQRLPGIGPVLAGRIVEARTAAFASVDVRRVKGIGARTLDRLRPHVRAGDDEP
ncbi:MAG: helix-hairpin-helix domain-containing protein [Gemmataceae bacterium]